MLERIRQFSPGHAQRLNRAGDALLLVAASGWAARSDGVFHGAVALALLVSATSLWLLASRALRQYDPGNGRGFYGDIALSLVMLGSVILPIALLTMIFSAHAVTGQTARFVAFLVPATMLLRLRFVGLRLWRSRPVFEVLVAGIGALGRLTGGEIGYGETHRRLVGYLRFDDEVPDPRLRAPLFGTIDDLAGTLRVQVVDEVYFASTAAEHAVQVQAAIRVCEELGVPFALPACAYRLTRARITPQSAVTDGYAHFQTVQVKPFQRWMKRLFDISASAGALALLSPLLISVSVLVKLTSRGSVLFHQERVGLLGRRFQMLKFRSMVSDAEALQARLMSANEQSGPVFKMRHDPRVTAVGRFIRKFSIDELPQLVNVLRGDMSVVGPRPPLPSEVLRYEAWQRRRLSVRPGLTCVWQVSGRNEISFRDWMLLDMRYIDHWSLADDFRLILRTFPVVLTGRGAS